MLSIIRIAAVALLLALAPNQALAQADSLLEQVGHFATGFDAGGMPLTIPSVDASGVAYHAPSGHLFIADSEINEIPEVWNQIQANLFEVSLSGDTLFASFDLGNSEPTGITYNEFDGHFYVTNDDTERIYRYFFDGNSFVETDSASTLPDSRDPEGVTSDPATGDLYVIDGLGMLLKFSYQDSGGVGQFTLESTIDLALGAACECDPLVDPEGIVFNSENDSLFLVSGSARTVLEYSLAGDCLAAFDISGFSPRPIAAQGLTIAPDAATGSESSLYMVDRGVDNDQDPEERDAAVYEGMIVPALAGEAFHFNGVADHLRVPTAAELYPPVFTVAAWVRPSALRDDDYIVSAKESGGYSLGINITTGGSSHPRVLSGRSQVDGVYYNVYGATELVADEWAHTALTYDGATFRLYLDGSEDGSLAVAGDITASSGDLFLGAESGGSLPAGGYFSGRMDEVALWNGALSGTQVEQLFLGPLGSTLPEPASLLGHWRFEDLIGDSTPDETGEHDASVVCADHVSPGAPTIRSVPALSFWSWLALVVILMGIAAWIPGGPDPRFCRRSHTRRPTAAPRC